MAAFDAGRIVATADLDRSPFQRGLQEAKREAATFADGKYSAKVGADTSEADRKVVDLRARLDRLNAERINPKIDLEGVNVAEARLAGLQAQMDALSRSGGGVGGGRGGLGGGRGGFMSRLPRGPGMFGLGIGAALPMAGPLGGVALGGAASFLSPTVAGGLGLGAFAAGAVSSIKAVSEDVEKLTNLQQRYNAVATNKQRAAVLRQEHQLWASLDPAQRHAVKNVEDLDEAWKRYQKALQPQSFRVLAEGAQIAEKGLRLLLPAAKGVGDEIGNLASSANTSLSQPFWRHFFHDFLAVEAPLAVHVLGTALGNTVGGIARLSEKFAPLGHDLENFLLNTSGGFNKWTQGGGPTRFVAWVRREAPIVEKDLQGLGKAIGGIGKGLAPIGQVELKALGPILNFVGELGDEHPAVITAVGTALLGVGAGLKVIAGVRGIQGILGGIGGLGRGRTGGIGGAIGKGAAVPVYVVNEGFGGMPGGGGGPGPGGRGGRGGGKLGVLGGLSVPLTLAYLGTQGGDVAHVPAVQNANAGPIGQALLPILHMLAAAGRAGTANNRTSPGAVAYDKVFSGRIDDPHGQHVNVNQAVGFIKAYGGPQAIAQLDQLAKKYPQVAAGVKEYNGQVSGLNRLLGINTKQSADVRTATSRVDDAVGHIPGTMRRAASQTDTFSGSLHRAGANARSAGDQIGTDLGRGLAISLERELHAATVTAKVQVSQLIKHIRFDHDAVNAGSPSKNMMPAGKDMADGLLHGWLRRLRAARGEFAGGALATIHGLENAAARYVAQTQGRLDTARGTLGSDRSARSGYIANLTSSYSGYANITGALNANGSVGSVRGFLQARLGKLRQFVGILRRLQRGGLSASLLQEIADQGPDGGIGLGQSILASGGIGRLDRLQRQIESYAGQGARIAGHAVFDPRIARDEQHVKQLVHEVQQERRELRELIQAVKANPHQFAAALGAEFRGAHLRATAGGH